MRAGHTALWCHLTPHKHPKTTLRQTGHVEHVPTVYLGLAPLKTAPASSPRGPARYMSTASPALCHGPDAFLDVHHSKHDSDPTTNQGQFRGAEHVSVVHLGLAPLKTAPEGCSRAPARYMPTASPALCRGLDGIFEVCHAKHGSDPTTNLGQPRGAEHIPAVYLGPVFCKNHPAAYWGVIFFLKSRQKSQMQLKFRLLDPIYEVPDLEIPLGPTLANS